MANMRRIALGLWVAGGLMVAPAAAQEPGMERRAYFRAVADFFEVAPDEITILGEWDLPAPEIPVALYVAERAGVSVEALVALRRSSRSWDELARRYHLDASHFHVSLPRDAAAGVLSRAYEAYRSLPAREWRTVNLGDAEIVGLVNLRVISQTLRIPAEEVLAAMSPGGSWVQLYASLIRESTAPAA